MTQSGIKMDYNGNRARKNNNSQIEEKSPFAPKSNKTFSTMNTALVLCIAPRHGKRWLAKNKNEWYIRTQYFSPITWNAPNGEICCIRLCVAICDSSFIALLFREQTIQNVLFIAHCTCLRHWRSVSSFVHGSAFGRRAKLQWHINENNDNNDTNTSEQQQQQRNSNCKCHKHSASSFEHHHSASPISAELSWMYILHCTSIYTRIMIMINVDFIICRDDAMLSSSDTAKDRRGSNHVFIAEVLHRGRHGCKMHTACNRCIRE